MTAETFERPGRLGRALRIVAGAGSLVLCLVTLTGYAGYVSTDIPRGFGRWLGIALCVYFLSEGANHSGAINRGFSRAWGRWPQAVMAFLAVAAMVYNFARYGTWWGLPLGVLIFVLVVYYTAHLGLSFVLAGILGHPG